MIENENVLIKFISDIFKFNGKILEGNVLG